MGDRLGIPGAVSFCVFFTTYLIHWPLGWLIFNSLKSTVSPAIQAQFFKISAKETKNTLLILVTQIRVIHQSKLLLFLCTLTITTNLCGFEKKKETNRVRSLSSPSPRTAFRNTSKMNCNSAKTQHTDMGIISIESLKCLLSNDHIENKHSVMK